MMESINRVSSSPVHHLVI